MLIVTLNAPLGMWTWVLPSRNHRVELKTLNGHYSNQKNNHFSITSLVNLNYSAESSVAKRDCADSVDRWREQ